MFKLLTLLSIVGFTNAHYSINFNFSLQYDFKYIEEFTSFVQTYNKSYGSNSYLLYRYMIFVENMDYMLQGTFNFYQSLNKWNISKIEKPHMNVCQYVMFCRTLE